MIILKMEVKSMTWVWAQGKGLDLIKKIERKRFEKEKGRGQLANQLRGEHQQPTIN